MTSTLVFTSSRSNDNALRIARVAAASRIAAERAAREAKAEAERAAREAVFEADLVLAQAWVAEAVAAGATVIGHKICMAEGGKWRGLVSTDEAAGLIARAWRDEDSVEAWGLNDAGEYVGGTF